jgi:2'-5' RNA ligase
VTAAPAPADPATGPWRLFVALELPDALRESLGEWRRRVIGDERGLRAIPAGDLHVTLCFLGAQPAGEVPNILAVCERVRGWPAARLALGDALFLPRRAPRVLAVGLDDAGGRLAAVQAELAQALGAGGWYRPDPRPFLAHATVARVRRGARVRARELPAAAPQDAVADRVTLFRSTLGHGGARYEGVGSVALAR